MIYVTIGPSGSGKSTYCKKMGIPRLNRDDIRSMLFSLGEDHSEYYKNKDLHRCEKLVTEVIDSARKSLTNIGVDFVVDNTHLRMKYLRPYEPFIEYGEVTFLIFHKELDECIANDAKRTRKVGEEIIRKQYKQYENLIKSTHLDELGAKFKYI